MGKTLVIGACRNDEELISAASSKVDMVFMLCPNIRDIKIQADLVHKAGKKLFIHIWTLPRELERTNMVYAFQKSREQME